MKRERVFLYITLVITVTLLAVTGYSIYVGQQTRSLLANRESPAAVERYARIQERLHLSKSSDMPVSERGVKGPKSKGIVEETKSSIEKLRHAEEDFARYDDELGADTVWDELWSDLNGRPASTWSPAEWKRLTSFLAEHDSLLEEARAMSEATGPVYPLDISEGYATLLPHLTPMRALARLLQTNAITQAHRGDSDGAANDIMAGLRLGARLEEEPVIISQLVRIAIDSIMHEGVVHAFPEGQIPAELAVQLTRMYDPENFQNTIMETWHMEESMGLDFLSGIMDSGWQQGRNQLTEFWTREDTPGRNWATLLYASPLARPWQHQDMLAYDRIMNDFGQTLETPYYEARDVLEQIEAEIAALPYTRLFTRNMLPSMEGIHRAIARTQTQQQLLLLGVAVESYANEHGTYPSGLEEVQGLAHGTSIIDPHTGAPFRYRADGEDFQLYSVGPNLSDDGGDHDFLEGDIVWRGRTQPKKKSAMIVAHKGFSP